MQLMEIWSRIKNLFHRTPSTKSVPPPTSTIPETLTPRKRIQQPPRRISGYSPRGANLPRSFTNRPGVKKAQVNLGKSGYRKDAKIEER